MTLLLVFNKSKLNLRLDLFANKVTGFMDKY